MNLTLNQQFLNRLIIVLVIGLVITGVLIGLKTMGVFGSDNKNAGSGFTTTGPEGTGAGTGSGEPMTSYAGENGGAGNVSPEETPEEKEITVTWKYKNEIFTYSKTVLNSTYYTFKQEAGAESPADTGDTSNGTVAKDRLGRYIATTGDDGLTQGIAAYFLNESQTRGWGDYDTIANLVTFMQHYDSAGSFQNLPPASSYQYPYQTFYEESGSRDDVTIFTAAVLEEMGYPVALIVYPRQYDRGYFIYPYEGIAIRSNGSVQGTKYYLEDALYVGNISCPPGPGRCTFENATAVLPLEGTYRGNTTICYGDNRTVPAGIADYDIRTGTVSYTKGFIPPADAVPDHFAIDNASWIDHDYFSYIDTADPTALPGTIPGALAKDRPAIVTTLVNDTNNIRIYRDDRMTSDLSPSLRSPSPLTASNTSPELVFTNGQSITDQLRIPVASGDVDDIAPANQQAKDEYWHDVWYDRSNWYYDQKWYLNVLDYNVIEDQYLYTREDEIFVAPATAWRIQYSAVPANPPDPGDVPDLSTFSDMRFAVYKVDPDTNTARLFDTFSYGYETGQNSIKYRNYYEPGSFYIAVFVRNCKATVSIQMHGKDPNSV